MLSKDTRIGVLAPVTWNVPPEAYGPWEKVVSNLVRGLVDAGYHNVTLYATQKAHIEGARTVGLLKEPLGEHPGPEAEMLESLHVQYSMEHAAQNVDILHNHFGVRPLGREPLPVPVVTTLHGCAAEPAVRGQLRRLPGLPFVSLTDAERAFAPELEYTATVPNGIDPVEYAFNDSPGEYMVYTGRLHPDKGVHNALALAERLGRKLVLAGIVPDNARDYYHQQIEPRLDGVNAVYVGNLPPHVLSVVVSNARAYVGLIEWDEPFGLSMAEAMVSGTPVIASRRGSHPEIVEDGVTGILVDSVDEAVARFPEVLHIDRRTCRSAALRRFGTDRMVEGYLDVYEAVLSGEPIGKGEARFPDEREPALAGVIPEGWTPATLGLSYED